MTKDETDSAQLMLETILEACMNGRLKVIKTENHVENLGVTPELALAVHIRRVAGSKRSTSH